MLPLRERAERVRACECPKAGNGEQGSNSDRGSEASETAPVATAFGNGNDNGLGLGRENYTNGSDSIQL